MQINKLTQKLWWTYLADDLQELLRTSLLLTEESEDWTQKFHDYSFVVFPASKAYEGFLKKLFLDLGFIKESDYLGRRFRIGKALNPSLRGFHRRRDGVYDKIVKFCGGKELASKLWDTWRTCRNRLFHWFPEEQGAITHAEAVQKVQKVLDTIDAAFAECKVDRRN